MSKEVNKKISGAIDSLIEVGGLSDPSLSEIIDKLKKIVDDKEKSKKNHTFTDGESGNTRTEEN